MHVKEPAIVEMLALSREDSCTLGRLLLGKLYGRWDTGVSGGSKLIGLKKGVLYCTVGDL